MPHNVVLGGLIDDQQQRDAIHVAVAPVVAAVKLYPGQDVGFVGEDRLHVGFVEKPIGIVDPFLKAPVFPDQRFWMLLYQQTITSLRHDWTHPAFGASELAAVPDKAASEAWLREFCDTNDCPSYEKVMRTIREGEWNDGDYIGGRIDKDYLHFDGTDAHAEIPPEFWTHVEVVLGPQQLKPSSFSCSC